MEIIEKVKILKNLDTKDLITKIHQYEDALEKAMIAEAHFKAQWHEYIASRGSDCQAVKIIIAELSVKAPETNEAGKKMTVPDRENWLLLQREKNKEVLGSAIAKQKEVAFLLDDYQIKVDMAKKRLEGVKIILTLKTAQINFLASD